MPDVSLYNDIMILHLVPDVQFCCTEKIIVSEVTVSSRFMTYFRQNPGNSVGMEVIHMKKEAIRNDPAQYRNERVKVSTVLTDFF